MSSFDSLLRISRWHLDEKRQKLADLERLAQRLRDDLERLDEGIETEKRIAEQDEEARRTFPAFLKIEQERRRRIEKSIVDVQHEIELAREEVAEAFREFKKYELAKATQDERLRRQATRREQARMDELGMQLHRRKQEVSGGGTI